MALVDWLAVMLGRPDNVVFPSSPHSPRRETTRALVTVLSFSFVLGGLHGPIVLPSVGAWEG